MCQSHCRGVFSLISLFAAMLMWPAYIRVTVCVCGSICMQASLTHYSFYILIIVHLCLSMSIYGCLQCIGTGAASNLSCPCLFQAQTDSFRSPFDQTQWVSLQPIKQSSNLLLPWRFLGLNYPKDFFISLQFVIGQNCTMLLSMFIEKLLKVPANSKMVSCLALPPWAFLYLLLILSAHWSQWGFSIFQ